jgi:hypothetical protein
MKKTTKTFWIVDYLHLDFKKLYWNSKLEIQTNQRGEFWVMRIGGTRPEIAKFTQDWSNYCHKVSHVEYNDVLNPHKLKQHEH